MDEEIEKLLQRYMQRIEDLEVRMDALTILSCEAMARTFPDPDMLRAWAQFTEGVVMDAIRKRGDDALTASYQTLWDGLLSSVAAYRRSADPRSLYGGDG